MPDQAPPKKPYTEEMFKEDSDLYIKGYLGGFDKGEMTMKLNNVISKIEDSGVMSSDEAKDFIKDRAEIYKKSIKERPGEPLPDFKAMGGRIGFLKGGDTEYNAMVTKKYIELGGEEGTGMDIDTFANEYFKKFNKGGRVNYGGGSDMGSVADSQGNVGPGTGGYQGGPQGGYGDAERDGGNDNPTFAPEEPPVFNTNEYLKKLMRNSPNFTGNPYGTRFSKTLGPLGLDVNTLGILGIDDPRTPQDETEMSKYNINVGGQTDFLGGNLNFGAGYNPDFGPSMGLNFSKQFNKGGRVNYNEGTQAPDTMAIRKRVEELMDDGETFGDAVKQAVKEIGG